MATVVIAGGVYVAGLSASNDGDAGPPLPALDAAARSFESNDPIERGCALERRYLVRIWRGAHEGRSVDLTVVPQEPNYLGSFSVGSHAGPWDYVQRVPLVFYGPGRIRPLGRIEVPATTADVYATVGRLLNVGLKGRDGVARSGILRKARAGVPKLVLTVVWDGVGRNVLRRWPQRWPVLDRMERKGASFLNATVGSSPSVTPPVHSTLGTGTFPRKSGVTQTYQRNEEGQIIEVFARGDPSVLERTTYADDIDAAYGNEPKVGLLAWVTWHLGMLGHGDSIPGGDADEALLVGRGGSAFPRAESPYVAPPYRGDFSILEDRAAELDRADGQLDGMWLGNDVLGKPANPAWMNYEGDVLLEMLERGGYGKDEVPDLLFTNFKATDLVGHYHSMDSREMADTLRAQDEQLGRIVDYLDREIGDYVVIVTSDHGHTPSYKRTGAWPISNNELSSDLARHFGAPANEELVQTTNSGLLFFRKTMRKYGVSGEDMAVFLNDATIRDNWAEKELPEGYEDRGAENLFSAAFLRSQTDDIMRCAFGSAKPPRDVSS
ncbi:MAG: alkaline phosphatase family protein [Actinomycetota bacterium]